MPAETRGLPAVQRGQLLAELLFRARARSAEVDPLQREKRRAFRDAAAEHGRDADRLRGRDLLQRLCLRLEHRVPRRGRELDEHRATVALPAHAVVDVAAMHGAVRVR
jgi:Tfp pilus assembly protein PilN